MNPKPYQLQISAKTQLFNFFRKSFIISGIDKLLPSFTRHSNMNTFVAKLIPPNYFTIDEPGQIVRYNFVKPDSCDTDPSKIEAAITPKQRHSTCTFV